VANGFIPPVDLRDRRLERLQWSVQGEGNGVSISLQVGDYEVRVSERCVLLHGEPLVLGARALDLLLALLAFPGQVVTKSQLMDRVWPDVVVEENNLSVQISALRKVLGAKAVVTVAGRGYQLGLPVRPLGESPVQHPDHALSPAARMPPPSPARPVVSPVAPDQPSLAVLPFANLTGDLGQDYFVDGLVDDLTNGLSRVRRFFVIARSSSFTYKGRTVAAQQVGRELGVRYLLEGSFRQAGERVRIGVQLIETTAGRQLWNQRFEGSRDDIFSLQDDITAQAVGAIEPRLVLAEVERARDKPTESLQAYDLCLRALPLVMQSATLAEVEQALAWLQQAIDIDPGYAYAMSLFAFAHAAAHGNQWIGRERAEAALPYAVQALQAHRDDPTTLAFAAISVSRLARRHEVAMTALRRALALNPSSAAALRCMGWVGVYVGDVDQALSHFERAMRLNPLDPEIGAVLCGQAFACIQAGRAEDAVQLARRALAEMPAFSNGHIALTAALAAAGRWHEVPPLSAECMKSRYPTIDSFRQFAPFTAAPFCALVIDTLHRLGVPP
jgi:TolB-like protein/Flp pilus assembly protein TadD